MRAVVPAKNDNGKQESALSYQALAESVQGTEGKLLNQSRIDSIFDYVPHPVRATKMVLTIDFRRAFFWSVFEKLCKYMRN